MASLIRLSQVLVGVLRVLCKYLDTDIVGIVVALSNASGSEVWDIVQSASAQYTFVPCSNDVHTFFISVPEDWLDPLR